MNLGCNGARGSTNRYRDVEFCADQCIDIVGIDKNAQMLKLILYF